MKKSQIIKKFIRKISKKMPKNELELEKVKRKFLGKNLGIISNSQLLAEYKKLVKKRSVAPNKNLEILLRKRKVRTLSGIATVAIFVKPYPCPGACLYCPTQPKMPKSYLSNEPAVMRAILCKYDPMRQIQTRLETLEALGHPTDKIELIVMGGTFSALPRSYQLRFIINCFKACNKTKLKISNFQFPISNKIPNSKFQNLKILKIEQQKNENAKHRIVGLTLETRPDYISENEIKWMRILGATRIELGVQSIYDDILKFNRRGHLVDKTIHATKLLKDAGFKINYHVMPNLPKSTPTRDLAMFKKLFSDQNFQPDMLKIYPCVLTKNAIRLKKLWQSGKYKPYSDRQLINLLIKIKQTIPPYVRIMRLGRDIPVQNILAGSKVSNIREVLVKKMEKMKKIAANAITTKTARAEIVVNDKIKTYPYRCRCIRCREIKRLTTNDLPQYHSPRRGYGAQRLTTQRIDYNASGGKEIFLSYEDAKNDKIIAFLRLRIPSLSIPPPAEVEKNLSTFAMGKVEFPQKHFISELQNAAIIREIHTYGQLVPIGKKQKRAAQHFGLGTKLVKQAEKIAAREFGIQKMAVISGVGVRNFWRKLGYKLNNTYMVKKI